MAKFDLNTADRDALQKLISQHKAPNRPNPNVPDDIGIAPDVYIAKPVTEIPKLLPGCPFLAEGTGTNVCGTGTDENSGSVYDEPGVALCDLYKIEHNYVTGDPELKQMSSNQKVYNITAATLPDSWILVIRTKWGKWIASPAGAGEAITVVTDFRVEGTSLQMKTRSIQVIPLANESDWTTVHEGTTCEVAGTATATAT